MRKFSTSAVAAIVCSLLFCGAAFAQSIDLQMNGISDNPPDITLGQGNVQYTVNIYNSTGSSTATNVVLTNTLPTSATYVSSSATGSGVCGDIGGGQVECTWPTLNAFNSATATIIVTPGAGGTNTFTASVTGDQGDPNLLNNTESETTTVNATIDLQMNGISDNPADITLGQGNVQYNLSTYNASSSKATNTVLTINLPASSTFVSASATLSGTCSESSPGVVTCNWAVHNAFNQPSVTLIITPGAGGTNTLTASYASTDQGDHVPGNNSESETTTVNATIDLQMNGISDNPADVTLGQGNVQYNISTYNASTSKATNTVLTLNLPASSSFVSASATLSGTCSETTPGVVTCNWAVHNAFNQPSVTLIITPGAGGTNTLNASYASTDQGDHLPGNNSESETTTVNATIDLQMNGISDNPPDVTLGQGNVQYTISTYNASTSKATNTVLTLNLPASSTFVSASATLSGTCSETTPGVVTCNWAVHNAFNQPSVTLIVTPGAGGTNTLTANYASSDQSDHVPGNNSESETTTVNATIDLQMNGISDNPADITLGQGNVQYSISTYNASTSKATNTVLTINLPASSTFVSASATLSGTCSETTPGVVACNWATHNAFNQPTVTLIVTPGAGGTNTLTASYASSDQSDHLPGNNSESETTTVNATIDLQMNGISDNPADITLGQGNVTYTISTYNASTSKATNTVLTLNLPASSTFVSASATLSGTCSETTPGVVTCNWATHNAFNQPSVTLIVTPGAGGTNTLTASYASSDQSDHVPGNNSESETTTVNATIDLQMNGINDSPADVTLGQGNVTYSISTYNASSSKATNTALTLNLPASSTFVSASATLSGTCSLTSPGVVTCNWATHNAFNQPSITLIITPGAGGTNTLTASYASSDQSDHVPANNSESETTTVNATIDLQVTSLNDNPADITLGQGNVTYTINTYNASTSKATNAVLTLNLPASSTFVSATATLSGTCTLSSPGVVTCTWANHNAFNQPSVTLIVTPGAGGTNTLTASVAADQGDHVPGNNSGSETTTVNATINLQLTMTDSPDPRVLAAGNVTYSITVFNASSSKATNPVMTLALDPTTTFVSAAPTTSDAGACSLSGSTLTCTWTQVAGSTSKNITVIVTPTQVGQISATASVTADQSDHLPANNTDTDTTNINPGSAPTISGFTPTSGPVGTTVTITGSNFFSSTAVKFNGVNSIFTVNGNGSITATVPSGATTGAISITNSVGTTTGGTFTVTPAPDLTISKTASAATVPTSSVFSYTLAVSNIGAGTAANVTVTDTLPAGVTLNADPSDTNWNCTGTTTITCTYNAGALAPGAAPNITLNVTAPASGTTVVNTATVSTTTPDANSGNNSSSVSVGVVGCPANPVVTYPATVCANTTGHTASIPAVPSATYAWTVIAGNGTITSPTNGTSITFDAGTVNPLSIQVDVFVTSCPTATTVFTVNVSTPTATITPSGPTTFCTGGSVTLNANNGASWLWSNGATTQSVVISATETLTVDVTDAAGCMATSAPTVVTVNNPPNATITPSGPTTFCTGGQVTLNAPAGITSYAWSNGATTPSIVVTNTGSYAVTITDANSCSATSAPTLVTVNAPPDTTITPSGPTTFCAGGSVTLTAPAGMTTYAWSNGGNTQSINVTSSGSYSVTVTDGNGCTATSAATNVGVNPAPTASITASGPTTFCAGGSVTLTANAGMTDYLWSNGATTQQITVNATGSYSVTVTDGSGCTATSAPVAVTVNPAPDTTITSSGPTTFCTGGSVTLTAPAAMTSYLWSTGATSQSITVNATGSFSVTVTDGSGCSATSSPTNVTVTPPPTATITASGPTTFCAGGSVTLTAPVGMTSYAWSNGATSQSITVSNTSSHTVTVTNAGGCSATSSPTSVTVLQAQPATITPSGPTTFCPGGSVTLTASAGSSYLWSNGATTPSITVATSGNFSVTVTDANGCTATSAATNVTVTPAPSVVISGPTSTCPASPVVLDAGPNFASYSWSTGATSQTITVTPVADTTYTVNVTDANGCPASDTHTVTLNSSPTANITAPASVCAGSSGHVASVPSQPGSSYAWTISGGFFNGASDGPSVSFTAQITTQVVLGVTVTTGSCTSTGNATIPITPVPSSVITAPSTVDASTNGHVASVTPEAGATYAWSITNGTISAGAGTSSITFSAGENGPITLTVNVTLNGCTSTGSAAVEVASSTPAAADLSITKSAPASVQAGSQFTYTIGVVNNGPALSQNASIVDLLPAGLTVVSFTDGIWTCSSLPGEFKCSGNVPAGSSSTISLLVLAPSQAGTITNTALVNGNVTPDPNSANNSASATTVITLPSPVCATTPASLLSPANGATVSAPVTFEWSAVANAVSYDVWITTEGATTLAGSTSSLKLTRPVPSGVSSWYVVANLASGCNPLTSAQHAFTVPPSSTCATNGRPQFTAPAGAIQTSPVLFSWNAVANAIGYNLWIEVDGTAAQNIGSTDGALSLSAIVPPGSIVAYVDARFSACPNTRSDAITFTVPQPDPCAGRTSVALIAPANNTLINSSSVEMQWTEAATADGYRVFASVDGAAPAVVGETTSETSLRTTFERGDVIWFVQALYDGCAATESARHRFTIPARNECSNDKPQLVSPVNQQNVTTATVTLDWNGVADAIGYEVWLGLDNGTPTLIATTPATVTSLVHLVPPGELSWFVRALIDRCPTRDSQSARFTYTPPAACEQNHRALLSAPLDDASIAAPVDFDWNHPGASRYELYVIRGTDAPVMIANTTASEANDIALATGNYRWFVRAFYGETCAPLDSIEHTLEIISTPAACATLSTPIVSAPGQISSGVEFVLQWTPIAGATSYQLQLSTSESFEPSSVISTTATEHELVVATTTPTARYARVRALDARCTPTATVGAFGPVSAIFILPSNESDGSAQFGDGSVITYTLPLGAELAGQTFTAITTEAWLSVSPASGVVPAGGIILTVTANTAGLPPGTSLGSVTINLNESGRVKTEGTSVSVPFGVSLVTPVTPTPKNTPPPDALVIPAVANADGIGSHFQSDVRVSNTSAQLMKYQLSFVPTGEAGITAGRQTTFTIEPGRTVALDDILKTWFGTGTSNAVGSLEVRPLTEVAKSTSSAAVGALANLVTFASSRTFNATPNGTFGQYIPAIPFANFIGKSTDALQPTILSLQQIAQSDKYRTNLGFVEASGEPAHLLVKVFGATGQKLTEFEVKLNGGQHTQLNGVLAQHGITSLDDGRVEVQVASGNGKVTAYASVLDNKTADPLLVSPVTLSSTGNTKWVVPGVADISNGTTNWQSDVRVFNAGSTSTDVTLSFISQNGGEPKTTTMTLAAGEVRQLDRVLSLFNASQDGGALHIATPTESRLIATARTYNQTTQGTYGQFISAVTPAESVAVGSRPLQLLQVEESARYRSNIGFAEVTGKPVTLEVSIVPPDAKFTATLQVDLGPNEFRQLNSMLTGVGVGDIYNARVSVRAVSGEGRATTYASVIDLKTNDPTYIPAQ